jgi:hypothetical protein
MFSFRHSFVVSPCTGLFVVALSVGVLVNWARAADPKLPAGTDPEFIKKLKARQEKPAKPATPPKEEPAEEKKDEAPKSDPPATDPAPKAEPAPKANSAPEPNLPPGLDPELVKRLRSRRGNQPKKESPPAEPGDQESPPAKTDTPDLSVTFSKHVAAILSKHCVVCHREGEIGQFSLLSYEEASKRAESLAEMASSRKMPPWKSEPNFGKFHGEQRLSKEEIALLSKWAKNGAPEGDAAELTKPPEFAEGWRLGKPDLELKMPEPFSVPAEGGDVVRSFVIPIPLDKDANVSAVEFRPGNRSVVHRATMFLDFTGAARKKESEDDLPGFESFGGPGVRTTGALGGWVPGAAPRALPDGIAKYVKKGSSLVLQIHYRPHGKEEEDQSSVGVYLSKKPPKQLVTGIAVMADDLEIPAGESRYERTVESQPLPVDVSVLAISPQMLKLGREMKVTATKPGSDADVPLVWIKDWDFAWKRQYEFEKPVRLPKGSVIKVQAVYDNSAEHRKDPGEAPQTVQAGETPADEMCLCSLQVATEKPTDIKLVAAMRGNELGAGLDGGFPGLALRKLAPPKKATATADTSFKLPGYDKAAERGKKKSDPFADGGVAIPEDQKKLLGRFDTDGDGKLSRKEVGKMPPAMQAFVVRTLVKKGGAAKW